jgi:hypothetical protein
VATWTAVACCWTLALGDYLARTKCRGGFGLSWLPPAQVFVVAFGGWRPRSALRSHVDLSHGLSAAEVHWRAVQCRWWSVDAAGCFHPSASPGEDLGSSSQCWSSRELDKVS